MNKRQLKIALTSLGSSCILMLNGCVGSGNGNSGSSSGLSSSITTPTATNSQKNEAGSNLDQLLTGFTLSGKQDGADIMLAGEIDGDTITIQMPPETTFPVTLTNALAGEHDGITRNGVFINDNSEQSFELGTYEYTVSNGSNSHSYNVKITPAPYFTLQNGCVTDLDGNLWLSKPDEYAPSGNWQNANSYLKSFSACGIPAVDPVNGKVNWRLPTVAQEHGLINLIPMAYRFPTDQTANPRYWLNSLTSSGSHLFDLPLADFWSSAEAPNNPNDALAMRLTANPGIIPDPKEDYFADVWPVSSDGTKAKSITDFSLTLGNGIPSKGVIVGQQIFVISNTPFSSGQPTSTEFDFSTSGGKVTVNGIQQTSGNKASYDLSQPIPITVTAANGDKNIYTLVVINPDSVRFTQFSLYDSVAKKMVNGQINDSNHTITVTLSDGANLYAKANFSTNIEP